MVDIVVGECFVEGVGVTVLKVTRGSGREELFRERSPRGLGSYIQTAHVYLTPVLSFDISRYYFSDSSWFQNTSQASLCSVVQSDVCADSRIDAPCVWWRQVLCFEEKKVDSPAKLYVMEVGRDKDAPGGVFRLAPQQIPNAVDAPNDFPVAMQVRST